jgi:CheY-like chemotaxis protein
LSAIRNRLDQFVRRLNASVDWFIPPRFTESRDILQAVRMFLLSHLCGPLLGHVISLSMLFLGAKADTSWWILFLSISAFWLYPPRHPEAPLRTPGLCRHRSESGMQAFDLMLLDMMMPEMSGLEVLARIRLHYSQGALPVIMVTAKSQSEDVVGALKAGANDYITKPVDFSIALARVAAQLDRKRAEEKIHQLNGELSQANEALECRVAERTKRPGSGQRPAARRDRAAREVAGDERAPRTPRRAHRPRQQAVVRQAA